MDANETKRAVEALLTPEAVYAWIVGLDATERPAGDAITQADHGILCPLEALARSKGIDLHVGYGAPYVEQLVIKRTRFVDRFIRNADDSPTFGYWRDMGRAELLAVFAKTMLDLYQEEHT